MGRVTITKTLQLDNGEELTFQKTLGRDREFLVTVKDNSGTTAKVTLTAEDFSALVKELDEWDGQTPNAVAS